jgi:putative MATE family efflux protein
MTTHRVAKKESWWRSFTGGLNDLSFGERYPTILGLFWPELITAFLAVSVLSWIDGMMIGHLQSTAMYATAGVTNTFFHFLLKTAEGLSVGTVILCGQYNGVQRYKEVGQSAISAFWVTVVVGGLVATCLYAGAYTIYHDFFHVPDEMVALGVSVLRIRAIGIFFLFVYYALIGFLRGIKNTFLPMAFFLLGGACYIFFDYALIFGAFGFPEMGFQGSALAWVLQYAVMLFAVLAYIFTDNRMRKYSLSLLTGFSWRSSFEIIKLSWPVTLDKAILAGSKMWLVCLISPIGQVALASFGVIREMEQFAFVPAIAFAQVITLLVSNDFGKCNWQGIRSNTKKIMCLAALFVLVILLAFSLFPEKIIGLFDRKGSFVHFAAVAFPILAILAILDLLQVILAGALRGAANVRVVMLTRLIACLGLFVPLSYGFSLLPIENGLVKFLLIYSSFYLMDGVIGLTYILWFRHGSWKKVADVQHHARVPDGTHNGKGTDESCPISKDSPGF